jgi:ornithine--oxo-acid transaminase
VRELRGRGLWIGIDLHPDAGEARAVCERLMERGVLAKDTHGSTIRLAPPLVVERDDLSWALDRIVPALASARRSS